jgi:PAS domain S-box-containing protein
MTDRASVGSVGAAVQPDLTEEPPVLIVDSAQRCVEVNDSASRMLGLERSEVVGRHVESLDLPDGHLLVLPRIEDGAGIEASPASRTHRAQDGKVKQPSRREREVLALLARGATDSQIALELELSPATVQTHVRNAKAKLGARTRAQAVALALVSGLIDL